MAINQLIAIIPFLLILSLSTTATPQPPTKPAEKAVDVVVEGLVYCQSCDHHGSWNLAGAKPIKSATIGVVCKDHRNRISYYKAFETNQNGYFYAELKGFKMTHSFLDHPLHSCKVRLVASPLKTCNLLTNVNYGLYGAPLRYRDKRIIKPNYEAVIYAGGPLAFRSSHCALKD
ncbi:hypothetical protein ACS0TY_001066 [Phlomoides rotata]